MTGHGRTKSGERPAHRGNVENRNAVLAQFISLPW